MSEDNKRPFSVDFDDLFNPEPPKEKPVAKPQPKPKKQPRPLPRPIKVPDAQTKEIQSELKKSSGNLTMLLVLVGIVIAGAAVATSHPTHHETTKPSIPTTKEVDHYPLKEAKLKRLGKFDASKPITTAIQGRSMVFNKGLTITVPAPGKMDDKAVRKDPRAILPSKNSWADYESAGYIDVHPKQFMDPMVSVSFYGNIIGKVSGRITGKKGNIVAIPQPSVGQTQTGYIMDDAEALSHNIDKYFIFSDGTGVLIEVEADDENFKGVPKKPTVADLQHYFPKQMKILDQDLQIEIK